MINGQIRCSMSVGIVPVVVRVARVTALCVALGPALRVVGGGDAAVTAELRDGLLGPVSGTD